MNYNKTYKQYPVTIFLIAANVLIFLFQAAGGEAKADVFLSRFSLFTPAILEGHEYYRLFTAMFLHFGVQHLYGNMISLFALGSYAETAYGSFRFALIYLISGLAGNLLTLASDLVFPGSGFAYSAGASGAVCGLLGVFFVFALDARMRRMFPMKRVLIAAALMLIPGLTDPSVNFTAHFGGVIGGFLSALALRKRRA